MDTGEGKFVRIKDPARLKQMAAKYKNHGSFFQQGEMLRIKDSVFKITDITEHSIVLTLQNRPPDFALESQFVDDEILRLVSFNKSTDKSNESETIAHLYEQIRITVELIKQIKQQRIKELDKKQLEQHAQPNFNLSEKLVERYGESILEVLQKR